MKIRHTHLAMRPATRPLAAWQARGACGAAWLALAVSAAHATLGGPPTVTASRTQVASAGSTASTPSAVRSLSGTRAAGASASSSAGLSAVYSIHESAGTGGGVVREFVGPDNRVFAVVWQGPFMPDLQAVLGNHFSAYAEAAIANRVAGPGRRPVEVKTSELVIHSAGRPRDFRGQAYLPALLPAGFSLDTLQ